MLVNPFNPHFGTNQNISPAAGAASITIDAKDQCVRLVNTGPTNPCHVKIGTSAQISASAATTSDLIIRPNSEIIVYKGDGQDTLSHISAAGTTLSVMTGNGGS